MKILDGSKLSSSEDFSSYTPRLAKRTPFGNAWENQRIGDHQHNHLAVLGKDVPEHCALNVSKINYTSKSTIRQLAVDSECLQP